MTWLIPQIRSSLNKRYQKFYINFKITHFRRQLYLVIEQASNWWSASRCVWQHVLSHVHHCKPGDRPVASECVRLLPGESPVTGACENYNAFINFTTPSGMNRPVRTGVCEISLRHTVGLLRTSDQPVAETFTYTRQHNI
jgi:hypothetical protein